MQRHAKILAIGGENVKMLVEAPNGYDLSRVKITFLPPDYAEETPVKPKKRKARQIGFHAIR